MHPPSVRPPHDRPAGAPRAVVIIPARYRSTRLPGKALADLAGRTLIERVYRRASEARGVDAVIVATDDARIAACVEGFGGLAQLTRPDHRSGTDRIAEVAARLDAPVVVNVQGDEPLVHPEMIEQVIAAHADGTVRMSSLRRAMSDPRDLASPHVVKVVVDRHDDALYFSRAPIPYVRQVVHDPEPPPARVFKHIGLYGYDREFLLWFASLDPTPLELAESLEQLRALEHGIRIRTPETSHDSIGVDTPDDLERVRERLQPAPAAAHTRRHEHTT